MVLSDGDKKVTKSGRESRGPTTLYMRVPGIPTSLTSGYKTICGPCFDATVSSDHRIWQ